MSPCGWQRRTWAYDAVGQVKTLTYGNTARATYTYDSTARTTGIRHSKSDGTLLAGYEYSYSSAGIPTGVVEGNGDRVTWTYDSAYRLTREQRSGTNAYDLTYTWDGAGNRLTKLASGTTTTYTYNAGDALTLENAAGTLTTLAYDNAGNTSTQDAAGSVTTYSWDDENRMTGIVLPSGGGTWTMAYNANGLRREKQAAASTTRFVWDDERLLQETDGSNATQAQYTSGLGTYGPTVSQRRGTASSFLHGSLLGTIEGLTAADQSVSDTYILDAWGNQLASSGSTVNPHRYVGALGYYTEPSLSLNYVRARWLSPGAGRWLAVDPMAGEPRYGYAHGRAMGVVDASGRQPFLGPPITGVSIISFPISLWYEASRKEKELRHGWELISYDGLFTMVECIYKWSRRFEVTRVMQRDWVTVRWSFGHPKPELVYWSESKTFVTIEDRHIRWLTKKLHFTVGDPVAEAWFRFSKCVDAAPKWDPV